jgi:hypothetical protein
MQLPRLYTCSFDAALTANLRAAAGWFQGSSIGISKAPAKHAVLAAALPLIAGDYSFETSMLNETSCDIHTFDCTYDGKSQGPRHFYQKWCVGEPGDPGLSGRDIRTWSNITSELQHKVVDLLKMDIGAHGIA